MRTPVKIGGFTLGLAAVFTAALGLGHAIGPTRADTDTTGGHGAAEDQTMGAHAELPAGLQVAQDGYRLSPLTATLATGEPQPVPVPDHRTRRDAGDSVHPQPRQGPAPDRGAP